MVRWIRFPYELKFSLSPLFYISISFKLHRFGRYCFNGWLICPSFLPFLPSLLSLYVSTSLPHFLLPFLSLSRNLSLCLIPSLNFSLYLYLSLFIYLSIHLSIYPPRYPLCLSVSQTLCLTFHHSLWTFHWSIGIAGEISTFELLAFGLDKKRVTHDQEIFIFSVRSADINISISDNSIIDLNSFNGTLLPCLFSQEIRNSACNFRDSESGHYYGSYIPIKTGPVLLSIFYNSPIKGNFHLFTYFNIVLFCYILFYFVFITNSISQSYSDDNERYRKWKIMNKRNWYNFLQIW